MNYLNINLVKERARERWTKTYCCYKSRFQQLSRYVAITYV